MKTIVIIVFFSLCCLSCKSDRENYVKDQQTKPDSEMVFDKGKWKTKDGEDYLYRAKMLNDVVYNDTIRSLNKDQLLDLLGEPDYYRDDKNFLHYTISESNLGFWTMSTKTMVIKLTADNAVEWIKIHE